MYKPPPFQLTLTVRITVSKSIFFFAENKTFARMSLLSSSFCCYGNYINARGAER